MKASASKSRELERYCIADGRVCPMPQYWSQLWEMLPRKMQKPNGGWEPPMPLILAAWDQTTDFDKQVRLREHIMWAEFVGFTEEIDRFLRGLDEDEWHCETVGL